IDRQFGVSDYDYRAHTLYSHRSATTGSTREAAIAGRLHAAIAVAATPTHATANEAPSVGWMSYKRLLSTRLVPAADTAPTAPPAAVNRMPCVMIIIRTACRVAPRAIRTPISCVRCATEYAITP